ncbi:hypothetical protein NMG60_11024708 [Bertholletia excelsa]
MMTKAQSLVWVGLLLVGLFGYGANGAAPAPTLAQQCNSLFEKVVPCLGYATGKAAAPTKECCNSVSEIKGSNPACLCYVIEQTRNGSEEVKSLGVREDRLLQLPSACKLTNASISDCPKLLKIPESSPEYKIFTNSSASSSTTSSSSSPATSLPTSAGGSGRFKHGPKPEFIGFGAVAVSVWVWISISV